MNDESIHKNKALPSLQRPLDEKADGRAHKRHVHGPLSSSKHGPPANEKSRLKRSSPPFTSTAKHANQRAAEFAQLPRMLAFDEGNVKHFRAPERGSEG